MESPRFNWLQFSLRELLLVFAFFGVACTALKYAGNAWELVLTVSVLALFMAAAVVAAVGRGRMQAAALGLALCLAIYGVLIWSAPKVPCSSTFFSSDGATISRELDPQSGRLPTSRALGVAYELVAVRSEVEMKGWIASGALAGPVSPPLPVPTVPVESPNRESYMVVGHWLWALLLGYAGARLALWCYDRGERRRAPTES